MPEHLRALLVILFLTTIFFALAKRPASLIIGHRHFIRRRNIWFILTLMAFLTQNFWIYTFVAIPILLIATRYETNLPGLFFFILFTLPIAKIQIPGLGLINFLFELSNARILALAIFLPVFFKLLRQSDTVSLGKIKYDKILFTYLLLTITFCLQETSLTNTFRQAFYLTVDILLPYFVISRSITNMQAFRDALMCFVLAVMILVPIAIFESYKHWLLYNPLINTLELKGGMTGYLGRSEMLRVSASAGHPIALGYLMVVGIGLYLFIQQSIQQKVISRLGMALLVIGLVVPLSRGPWVGFVVLLTIFIATGRKPALHLAGLSLAIILTLSMIAELPGGERIINLFPFIGTIEKSNIDYRENLITNSIVVIKRNPWFGSANYLDTPEMEAMRQGQGIIDVVNTFIGIALEKGIVGLSLFVGFFALVIIDIFRAMRSISNKSSEEHQLGRALLATLLAILTIIATVSSISVIPIVYWSVAGLGVAYVLMARKINKSDEICG